MGALISSQSAGRDFTEVRHINKTHVELAKKQVISKIGGFNLINYVSEGGGTTFVDYGNGTTQHVHHLPQEHSGITGIGLALEIVISAITLLLLLKIGLAAARAIRKYRNYKAFHAEAIGEEGRGLRAAFKSLTKSGPTEALAAFYAGGDEARVDLGRSTQCKKCAPARNKGGKTRASSARDDSSVMFEDK